MDVSVFLSTPGPDKDDEDDWMTEFNTNLCVGCVVLSDCVQIQFAKDKHIPFALHEIYTDDPAAALINVSLSRSLFCRNHFYLGTRNNQDEVNVRHVFTFTSWDQQNRGEATVAKALILMFSKMISLGCGCEGSTDPTDDKRDEAMTLENIYYRIPKHEAPSS